MSDVQTGERVGEKKADCERAAAAAGLPFSMSVAPCPEAAMHSG